MVDIRRMSDRRRFFPLLSLTTRVLLYKLANNSGAST